VKDTCDDYQYIYPLHVRVLVALTLVGLSLGALWVVTLAILKLAGVTE